MAAEPLNSHIARKLAASTSLSASDWKFGQIPLVRAFSGWRQCPVVGLPFPQANTAGRSRLLSPSDDGKSVGEVGNPGIVTKVPVNAAGSGGRRNPCLNLLAGVWNPKVFLGRRFKRSATWSSCACE